MLPVIVIDEDIDALANLERLLQALGLEVIPLNDAGAYLAHDVFSLPHVAVIPLSMQAYYGMDIIKAAILSSAATHVFAVASNPEVSEVVQAVRIGVSDVLQTPIETTHIINAAKQDALSVSNLAGLPVITDAININLTKREKEVLKLVLKAKSNQEIASAFKISIRTVEAHRSKILKKFNAKNHAELMNKLSFKNGEWR